MYDGTVGTHMYICTYSGRSSQLILWWAKVSCVILATRTGQWSTGVWLQGAVTLIRMASACSSFPRISICTRSGLHKLRRTRDGWEATKHSVLCSMHFEADCFEAYSVLSMSMGLCKKVPKLKPDAVPTIFKRPKRPADSVAVNPVLPKKSSMWMSLLLKQ